MAAGEEAWVELMKTSFGMVSTCVRASEMMIASSTVVGARMTIMCDAARSPANGDYEEIGGMMHEKVIAYSKVGQALVDQWSGMLIDASEQAQHVVSMLDGRPLGARDLSELAERWLAHGTRMITRTMETGELVLAPVHQQATVNALRLG